MTFSGQLRVFTDKVTVTTQAVFVNSASRVLQSIQDGSPVTGAPGQPVDTGNLRASWQLTFESPTSALVSTNVEYAPVIEDNIKGVRFKNHGPHSVKITRAGLQQIVDYELAQSRGGNG